MTLAPNTESEWVMRWPGIHKMTEELGELVHVASQLKAYPIAEHPALLDGDKPILCRLQEELADVLAAVSWFVRQHHEHLDAATILDRFLYKIDLYDQWHALGNMQGVWTRWPDPSIRLNGLIIDKAGSRQSMHGVLAGLVASMSGEKPWRPIDADFAQPFEGEFGELYYHDGHPTAKDG